MTSEQSPVRSFGRSLLFALLVIVFIAAALSLVTWLTPTLRENALEQARKLRLGRAGIVLAGVLAPILYLFKSIGEWFSGLFGSGKTEREIADRTRAIEADIAKLRREVNDLETARTRALEVEHARIAALEAHMASLRGTLTELDEEIEHRLTTPPPPSTLSDEELVEKFKNAPGFIELPIREEP